MSNLNDMRTEIAGKLTAAGLTVSTDPKVQVPAILVGAPTVLGSEGVGGWRVEYSIQVLGVPPGNEESLTWMLDQVEQVLIVFPGPAFPRTIEHVGTDVPAYEITTIRSVVSPNC